MQLRLVLLALIGLSQFYSETYEKYAILSCNSFTSQWTLVLGFALIGSLSFCPSSRRVALSIALFSSPIFFRISKTSVLPCTYSNNAYSLFTRIFSWIKSYTAFLGRGFSGSSSIRCSNNHTSNTSLLYAVFPFICFSTLTSSL